MGRRGLEFGSCSARTGFTFLGSSRGFWCRQCIVVVRLKKQFRPGLDLWCKLQSRHVIICWLIVLCNCGVGGNRYVL